MSVIVRGMPMPKACIDCDFLTRHMYRPGWLYCKRTGKQTYERNTKGVEALNTKRDTACPLFEVKAWEDI